MTTSSSDLLRDFKLARYQPNDIILIHRSTKRSYQFHDQAMITESSKTIHPHIQHPYLLRPTLISKGLLYPKPHKTLKQELETRRRSHQILYFSEEELLNTFQPVFQCVRDIHSKGISHGKISSEHIIFTEKGEIKLKDWLVEDCKENNAYYPQSSLVKNKSLKENSPQEQDLKALGLILIEAASLKQIDIILKTQFEDTLATCFSQYSKQFIIFVMGLVYNQTQKVCKMIDCLVKDGKLTIPEIVCEKQMTTNEFKLNLFSTEIDSSSEPAQILADKAPNNVQSTNLSTEKPSQNLEGEEETYQKIRKIHFQTKKAKKNSPEPKIQHQQQALTSPGQISPSKKFMISSTKKPIRLQEPSSENKKILHNDDVKKKHIEKITKIIERSNAFVNELMTRRTTDSNKKYGSKMNISFHGNGNQNANQTPTLSGIKKVSRQPIATISSSKQGSPSKRLRVIQKKK